MKKPYLHIHPDGAISRIHNKRIGFKEDNNGGFILFFQRIDTDKDSLKKPSCRHKVYKGKIRSTELRITNEAFEALAYAFYTYKKSKS